jgi:diaminopimelate decarboxylase
VDAHTHDFISTGKKDSKFGFPLQREILFPHLQNAIDSPYLTLKGIHFHIGSQLHDNATHLAALSAALCIYRDVKEKLGYLLEDLNIGGGFGIHYTEEDDVKPYSYFLDPVMAEVSRFCAEAGLPEPTIVIEPGRSIVGEAGLTLYRVGSIKTIEGVRKYVSVDGGMSDNIRPALYGAKYECVLAEKTDEPKEDVVTICGKLCETGDKLINDAKIASASRGDLLAVFSTGAYGYSMASNYNKNPIPGVVLIDRGVPKQIVRRQTLEDLIRNEATL